MQTLSCFRDLQVQQALLAPLAPEHPALHGYLSKLRTLEVATGRYLAERLRSFPEADLAQEVKGIVSGLNQVLVGSKDETRAARGISDHLAHAHRRLLLLRSTIEPKNPATIHRLRVAFKKYRYLVEPLAPLSTNPDPDVLSQMHDLQGDMGDIQDLAVLLRGLRSWAAASSQLREIGPALRILNQRLEERVAAFSDRVVQLDSFRFELRPSIFK